MQKTNRLHDSLDMCIKLLHIDKLRLHTLKKLVDMMGTIVKAYIVLTPFALFLIALPQQSTILPFLVDGRGRNVAK